MITNYKFCFNQTISLSGDQKYIVVYCVERNVFYKKRALNSLKLKFCLQQKSKREKCEEQWLSYQLKLQ